jgi:plasmid replication initiation protein
MATIWDADILIYCASMLADMARRGTNDIPRKLHIMPYDQLRAIGRPVTGRPYELLGQALDGSCRRRSRQTSVPRTGRRRSAGSFGING